MMAIATQARCFVGVAERMDTTKSAVSRLKSAGRHAPSLATLKRYASVSFKPSWFSEDNMMCP